MWLYNQADPRGQNIVVIYPEYGPVNSSLLSCHITSGENKYFYVREKLNFFFILWEYLKIL